MKNKVIVSLFLFLLVYIPLPLQPVSATPEVAIVASPTSGSWNNRHDVDLSVASLGSTWHSGRYAWSTSSSPPSSGSSAWNTFYPSFGNYSTSLSNIDEVFEIGPDDVVMGEYSWVYYYGIEDLMAYYDTVVLGTIGEIVAEYNDAAPDVRPRPTTDYSFNVEKVLFDRYGRDIDSQIVIMNDGGTHEGVRWVSPHYPPFVEGERMVIFLKERAGYHLGEYWRHPRGGYSYHPQGRFIIRDDQVYTIRLRSPRAQLVLKQYHDVPLDQFLDEINAAAEVMKQFTQYRFEAEDVDLRQFVNWQGTSWTFAARIECSALIVTGTVTGAVNTFDREADNPDKVSPVPFTEYAIIVEEVIFNRYDREIGDSITVQNPGGVLEGTRYITLTPFLSMRAKGFYSSWKKLNKPVFTNFIPLAAFTSMTAGFIPTALKQPGDYWAHTMGCP